ncbi:hypothetical protein [Nocardioides deserti]|uniref:Uncharacterized protein n=1 Tax=Nocardioides deserti TaxID=1588644 RepID=A0ABR6UAC8_9ACTN|nr:hypothetical protein [Nocardioides deserti]MBC2961401.1 hypothetical protein [Nocardioides deserti]GGO72648.1 hypothetical protein GCM10012276_16500 [Nocardioides deserti]
MVTRRRLVVPALLSLLLALLPTSALAPPVSADPQSVGSGDVVGRSFAFRTLEVDRTPRPADSAACREHAGTRGGFVPMELDARLFSVATSEQDGRVVDETRRRVGTGYLCVQLPDPMSVPAEQSAGGSAYARLRLPTAGRVEAKGWCAVAPALAQPGNAHLACRLSVLRDRRTGVVRGALATNTILNPVGTPLQPAGSLWTAYVETRADVEPRPAPASAPVSGTVAGDALGARAAYVLARGRRIADPPSSRCFGSPHETALHRVTTRGRTGVVPSGSGRRVGLLVSCVASFEVNGMLTAFLRVVGPTGERVELETEGRCVDRGRPTAVLQRVCELRVLPAPQAGVQGGLVTTLGPALAPVGEIGPGDRPLVAVSLVPLG